MPFSERLNAIMKVQGITNNRLAKALSVDPSLISRWNKGSRSPAKNPEYIRAMAAYFANNAKMDSQRMALCEAIGITPDKNDFDPKILENKLYEWLANDSSTMTAMIEGFLGKIVSSRSLKQQMARIPVDTFVSSGAGSAQNLNVEVYSGYSGKNECVIRFLNTVISSPKPITMLLFSEESMEWLTSDKSFSMKWAALIIEAILKGHRIKIIHTLQRDLSEMLAAIDKWFPLYMTGAIESYYYPEYSEHVFKRTMFIAPGMAAISSTSLTGSSGNIPHYYYTDHSTVDYYTKEFQSYLKLCQPLMQIFTSDRYRTAFGLLGNIKGNMGEFYTLSGYKTTAAINSEIYEALLKKIGLPDSELGEMLKLHFNLREELLDSLNSCKYTEIIALPLGSVVFDVVSGRIIQLDRKEAMEIAAEDIKLLEKYKNYNLVLQSNQIVENSFVAIKEGAGVIVAKHGSNPVLFSFNHKNMTNAFVNYMQRLTAAEGAITDKAEVIKLLLAGSDNIHQWVTSGIN
ncbi:MAG: helix-turn-helix transcriptional regulator [Eubacteriales bacterium]|nr:helix-turn-helix transcriptional regulator [Eubacteriales bacterium]